MELVKRNLPLVLLIVASIIILSSFSYAFVKKDDATFYLKDIKGDRSALNDIVITGILQDRFHGQYFEIKEGKVNHRFKYYDSSSDFVETTVNYSNGISSGDLVYWFQSSYEIAPDADTKTTISKKDSYGDHVVIEERTISANKVELIAEVRLMHKDFMKPIDKDRFNIDTGIIVEADGFEYEITETVEKLPDGTEYTVSRSSAIKKLPINGNSNCMALMDDKLYFVVPTTKKCSGENGIFVVDEFEAWWMASLNEDGKEKNIGRGRKIVKLDLSEHNIDILGLEAVNDQLLLVMMVDNILTLRSYDKDGNFIDEIYFQDIDLYITDNSQIPIVYDSFTNGNILNLSLNIGTHGSAQPQALISVEIEKNIKEKHKIQNPDFINEATEHYNIHTKGNKLYIVSNVQRLTESGILRPRRFIIMVYENAELLYKGELVTDADEDLEIERLKSQTGSFGYNILDLRHFVDIELR